ncbi:aurora kinase A- and ninein-interacting protein [Leptodactylus fuscus]
MKNKKRTRHVPQPEECGVWLDASQLKKKAHQAVIPCTTSRFNPLLRRQPTDSVLVEFTQTKSPQLCTKQTSMYSFFSPAGNKSKEFCITDINTLTREASPKREKRTAQETPSVMKLSPIGSSPVMKQIYSDRETANNQEDIKLYNMNRNTEKFVNSRQNENFEKSCDLGKPGNHVGYMFNDSICSAQQNSLNSPMTCRTTGFDSKYQYNLYDSECAQDNYNKPNNFPPHQCESQLFTQDTQGNKVIRHRFTSDRCTKVLHDRTNVNWHTGSPVKENLQTVSDEDSLCKMFTQDSEGNMVIKH